MIKLLKYTFVVTVALLTHWHSTSAQVITTIAGGGSGTGEGVAATSVTINNPSQSIIDKSGNLYVPQLLGQKVSRINSDGTIVTIAGTGVSGNSGDGGPATAARLYMPNTVAIDDSGNVVICDNNNSIVRKIDALTGNIRTIAGNGIAGYSGDNGPATNASLMYPAGICYDKNGNLLISDGSRRVRKVAKSGIITTIAGVGLPGVSGDGGPATTAKCGGGVICTDKIGNIYVADNATGESRIAKIDTNGLISTYAGTSSGYIFNGDDIPATSANINPIGMSFDKFGNLIFADFYNNRIRMVDKFGIVRTIAGTGLAGFSGDGGLATLAQLNRPQGIAVDTCGNIYVSDNSNARIRKITFSKCGYLRTDELKIVDKLSVFPNPTFSTVKLSGSFPISSFVIVDVLGKEVMKKNILAKPLTEMEIDVSTLLPGVYIVRVNDVWTARLVKE
ncbi:MAG: T9SS type A sorting domain-containing protein [Chitinophagaceae bacterium]|nr:T9SS type A sorting domain-containing protein [Chitinophagaceae bacterium]